MPADPQSAEPVAVLPPDIREEVTQALRMWARKKFGKWITWQTAWTAAREICGPVAKALLAERQAREAAEQDVDLAKDEGVDFVFGHLAVALGLSSWVVEEGSETWDGDVCATLMRILRDSHAIDPETDTRACDRAEAAEASLAKAEARIAELEAALGPFAEAARGFDYGPKRGVPDNFAILKTLVVGDLRRARLVLSSINKEPSHEI